VFATVGANAFRSAYRQYANGPYLTNTVDSLVGALDRGLDEGRHFQAAVDDLVGADAVPAMTIHKSKGLEFSTIVFLGIEDDQWWAFENQSAEETRNFFVGISRASENVILTFSEMRDRSRDRGPGQQRKDRIAKLYEILSSAGVQTVDCR
jgi:DNA helicase-2/ATP-dependent DNA helicase PcrA